MLEGSVLGIVDGKDDTAAVTARQGWRPQAPLADVAPDAIQHRAGRALGFRPLRHCSRRFGAGGRGPYLEDVVAPREGVVQLAQVPHLRVLDPHLVPVPTKESALEGPLEDDCVRRQEWVITIHHAGGRDAGIRGRHGHGE